MNVDIASLTQFGFAAIVTWVLLRYILDNQSKKLDKIVDNMELISKSQGEQIDMMRRFFKKGKQ